MNFGEVKGLVIPEGKVKQITRKSDSLLLWKGGYTNLVPLSVDSSGAIYNGTGYKNGYRVRSGGAEGAHGGASCTGFIPAAGGDVVRLSGYDVEFSETANAINVFDASHSNLGQITSSSSWSYGVFEGYDINWDDVLLEKDDVYCWTVPDGYDIAYIRVTGYTGGDGSKMIVTVNEEIE